jgi:uncharacterized protein (TIRG00374 family)
MRPDWRGVLGVLLSAGFLWWALHDVQWAAVLAHVRDANVWLLVAAVATATLAVLLRVPRWRVILYTIDPHVQLGALWRSTAIGLAINNVVPARVGEIARAYALTRETPSIPFSASFASLAVDRVFDAVAVLLLMVIAVIDPAFPRQLSAASERVAHTLGLGTVAAVAVLVLLYLLVFLPHRVIVLYEHAARRVAPRFEARGRDALLAFAAGLGVLRSPRRFVAVLAWTFAFWLLNALAFWIGFRAFGIGVSYSAALLVQGIIVVGIAIPQAPGFFGVFEAAARWSLAEVYGVSSALAVSWAIGYHLSTFIPITLIGLTYFVRLGLHLRELNATREAPDARAAPVVRGAAAPDDAAEPAPGVAAEAPARRR